MKLVELAAGYLAIGLVAAVVVVRARPETRGIDRVFAALAWPIFAPLLLQAEGAARGDGDAARRGAPPLGGLREALAAIDDPALRALLPTQAQIDPIERRIEALGRRARALEVALAREHAQRTTNRGEGEGAARLGELLARAIDERDELIALCERLRMQLTLLRFTDDPGDGVGELAAEVLGRVEGVGEAFGGAPGRGVDGAWPPGRARASSRSGKVDERSSAYRRRAPWRSES